MPGDVLGASFRDPGGFLFERDGVLYRHVAREYASEYDRLMDSGLYAELVEKRLLVPHGEVDVGGPAPERPHRTLRPERIPFVSHPYEWCFGQLRDAARTTLRIQQTALRFGMTLKDASAYNVQFRGGRPVFIDTLSFAHYHEGAPWAAYRQFCQHFLAPLALMAHRDVRLGELLRVHLDGIPLDLARALLPARAWLDLQLLLHIRVHARYERRYQGDTAAVAKARPLSRRGLENLVTSLDATVAKLRWEPAGTEWGDYETAGSYVDEAAAAKRNAVAGFLDRVKPANVWDLGANRGDFSRLASERGAYTVAFDVDPAAVEHNHRRARKERDETLLPLRLDLTSPSPALGWAHRERASLVERSADDTIMALALIHHLALSNNVPLPRIADLFASLAEHAIVEWVPKEDEKVRVLLATREDVFPDYTEEGFTDAFAARFEVLERVPLPGSERALYLLRRRGPATSPP